MGQRHEVARCSERALLVDHGVGIVVEQSHQALHGVELAARVAIAQRLNLQQKHDFHNLVWHALSRAAGVALDQVHLKLRELVFAYRHVAQRAEARGDTVDGRVVAIYLLVEIGTAAPYPVFGFFAQLDADALLYYFSDLFYRDVLCTDVVYHSIMVVYGCERVSLTSEFLDYVVVDKVGDSHLQVGSAP